MQIVTELSMLFHFNFLHFKCKIKNSHLNIWKIVISETKQLASDEKYKMWSYEQIQTSYSVMNVQSTVMNQEMKSVDKIPLNISLLHIKAAKMLPCAILPILNAHI